MNSHLPFLLRRFQPDDVDAIIVLFRNTIHRINRRDYTEEQLAAWAPPEMDRERWLRRLSESHSVVCEWNGKITGFGNLRADGYVDLLYVHADHQAQGVGTLVLKELERAGREIGLTKLFTEASITARHFFERHGFQVTQPQEVLCRGVRLANFVMERNLD